jgi:hypothetical protein
VAGLCGVAGCGGGRIELASLNFRAIDPPAAPPPRFGRIDLDCCYWWTDDEGQLWIAMQREQTPFFNPKLRFEFQLSLRLKKLPAGAALDYQIGRQELRGRLRMGPLESRFTSTIGIVALYREPNDRLRGSLRLQAARVTTRWLGGWGRPARYLMLGSFVAVHDEQRGHAIAQATESQGWGRDTAVVPPVDSPRSQPSSKPAGAAITAEMKPE